MFPGKIYLCRNSEISAVHYKNTHTIQAYTPKDKVMLYGEQNGITQKERFKPESKKKTTK